MSKNKNTTDNPEYNPASDGEVLVAVFNNTIYVKPFGFATQQNALGLPDFLNAMFREGAKKVTFDLKECKGMDSTFLGVIATAALSPAFRKKKNVLIINAEPNAKKQLQRIGLLDLVALKEEPCPPPPDLQLSRVDFFHLPQSERERIARIKDLHKQLIQLNERNRQNFGAFVSMLEDELKDNNKT